MKQKVFVYYMEVSPKTVEAWECERTHPTGSASRLLDILSKNDRLELPLYGINNYQSWSPLGLLFLWGFHSSFLLIIVKSDRVIIPGKRGNMLSA